MKNQLNLKLSNKVKLLCALLKHKEYLDCKIDLSSDAEGLDDLKEPSRELLLVINEI